MTVYKMLRTLVVAIGALMMPSVASAQNGPCGMVLNTSPSIFCDTFDVKKNPAVQSRTGDLDPNVWGVSRTGSVNFGSQANLWVASALIGCNGTTTTVQSPNDIVVCNGQLRQTSNDMGGVTVLAMYPKQPFDFAGRTGTVSFDVSNDSQGSHAAWPEFWFTDTPVPAPFSFQASWRALPQHGFGLRFHTTVEAGQFGYCPNGNNLDKRRWTAGSVAVIRNWVLDDTEGFGTRTAMNITILDCVISSPDNSGIMNHIEVRVSQNQIDVYATDAGVAATPSTLRLIARVTNANLSATRGLVWLQDVHYNADKAYTDGTPNKPPSQRQHTFVWDNLAFDGPFTYRDFSYDALDANVPNNSQGPGLDLGKMTVSWQTTSWNVLNMPANPQAAAVRLLFNFFHYAPPAALNVIVNGKPHPTPWPYPDTQGFTWRTLALTIPVTDLVAGTNAVQISATDQTIVVANVNIVLVNVRGGVPILPGSNNGYPVNPGGDTTPPTAPSNLAASAVSSSTINLVWTASTDSVAVTGYKIFRGGAQIATSPGASYNNTGLTPNTQYTYQVSAYDAAGNNSPQSSPASATTQPATPVGCTVTIAPFAVPRVQGQSNLSLSATSNCQ